MQIYGVGLTDLKTVMKNALRKSLTVVAGCGLALTFAFRGHAQEKRFLDLVGASAVGPMPSATSIQTPYIT